MAKRNSSKAGSAADRRPAKVHLEGDASAEAPIVDDRTVTLASTIVRALRESPDPRKQISDVLTSLVALTDGMSAAFSLLRFDSARTGPPSTRAATDSGLKFIDVIEGGRWSAEMRQSYMNYLNDEVGQDPFAAAFFEHALRHPAGKCVVGCRREVLSDEAWYGSNHFKLYRGAVGLDDCIYGAVLGGAQVHSGEPGLPEGVIAGFSLHRLKGNAFTMSDRELARIALAAMVPLGIGLLGESRFGAANLFASLTPRQRDVLVLLNEGMAIKQIADHLRLSPASVHTYVQALCKRLGVRGRIEALALCNKKGWLVGLSGTRPQSKR